MNLSVLRDLGEALTTAGQQGDATLAVDRFVFDALRAEMAALRVFESPDPNQSLALACPFGWLVITTNDRKPIRARQSQTPPPASGGTSST